MGAGLYVCVNNYSQSTVEAVMVFAGMQYSNGDAVSPVFATLASGASTTPNPGFYVESDDTETSAFEVGIAISGGGPQTMIRFNESDMSYTCVENTNPLLVSVDLTNASDALPQAWLSITVLPYQNGPGRWMTAWPALANLPINQICLPGSHDAGTYVVQPSAYVVEDDIIITQAMPVQDQLLNGSRFFDVRPGNIAFDTTDPMSNALYHMHCPDSDILICCAPYSDMLGQFAEFAGQNPGEFFIVQLSHFQDNLTGNTAAQASLKTVACQQAFNALGPYMVPNSAPLGLTLAQLRSNYRGQNIFVCVDTTDGIDFGTQPGDVNIVDATGASVNDLFWPMPVYSAPSPPINNWNTYANTADLGNLISWIASNVPTAANQSFSPPGGPCFDLFQCQMSPQDWDVAGYDNLDSAAASNPMLQQMCGMHMNPSSATAQAFAANVNVFLIDGVGCDTPMIDLATASNFYKLSKL